tara:strand:- start:125 stop:400 length:276 start_codon:yes stop_codon:yes gene_type:complete
MTTMDVNKFKPEMLTMSHPDLNQLIELANKIKVESAKSSFVVGQKVRVVQKTKSTPAKILKMNRKKAIVEMDWNGRGLTKCNVPYTMLEVI